MSSKYAEAVELLESLECGTCRGLGKCDDSAPGDISFATWTCNTCGGSGFKRMSDNGSNFSRVDNIIRHLKLAKEHVK